MFIALRKQYAKPEQSSNSSCELSRLNKIVVLGREDFAQSFWVSDDDSFTVEKAQVADQALVWYLVDPAYAISTELGCDRGVLLTMIAWANPMAQKLSCSTARSTTSPR